MARRKQAAAQYAGMIYDALCSGDMTAPQIMEKTGLTRRQFEPALQMLRDLLAADGDTISVVCEIQGQREPWLYGLRAGESIISTEKSRWVPNQLQHAERRVKTLTHVLETAVNSLDGRTKDGKKARIYLLHLKRAQEEVQLVTEPPELPL